MSSAVKLKYLPLLWNPFLNCLFNNAHPERAPFKQTIDELGRNHNDYTILVPPCYIQHDCFDPTTTNSSNPTRLRELFYNDEDFIRSHIIRTGSSHSTTITPISKVQSVIYNTMNGKQLLIKNGMIFTGKGFKKSLKLRILYYQYVDSISDYFPKGSKLMIIYIENSLFGSYNPHDISPISSLINSPNSPNSPHDNTLRNQLSDSITFEKLLRNYPILSKAVSEKFYRLFHNNNKDFNLLRTTGQRDLADITDEFYKIRKAAFDILQESVTDPNGQQTYEIIDHIQKTYPQVDQLIHEYVELNLYDKLWSKLIYQFNFPNDGKTDEHSIKILTNEKYDYLSCLALNQLDAQIDKPWQYNEFQKRIVAAIQEFSKLSDASIINSRLKTEIISKTYEILAESNKILGIEGDADILLPLLIMVVVHSKVDNIEAHVYYIESFTAIPLEDVRGLKFMVTNLRIVFAFLSMQKDYARIVDSSQHNFDLWSCIQHNDINKFRIIIDNVKHSFINNEIPYDHFLKSKNINGESCIMFAIRSKNYDMYNVLINENPTWFSIDEILFDKNITTNQTLLMIALTEECNDISNDLVNLILTNATLLEQKKYFNLVDSSGRSVGHYIFHNYHLIDIIGHLIDWELKDMNTYTPLYTVCRCYDHLDYGKLISKAFDCVYKKYGRGNIDFDKHMDKLGNTLLHIIRRNLKFTELLQDKKNLVNVNQVNHKFLSPLNLYVKANRIENLRNLLVDDRLNFLQEDTKNWYNVLDFLGFSASKATGISPDFKKVERLIFDFLANNYSPKTENNKLIALNAKYDPSRADWVVYFLMTPDKRVNKSLESIKSIISLQKLENPLSIYPDVSTIWNNYGNGSTTPYFHKLRVNRLIDQFNIYFKTLIIQEETDLFEKFISDTNGSKNKSTLELFQEMNEIQEQRRRSLGEVTMTRNAIKDIEGFIKYTKEDLIQSKTQLTILRKLIAVGEIKQADVRFLYDRLLSKVSLSELIPELSGIRSTNEYTTEDHGYSKLLPYISWLEITFDELFKHMNHVLNSIQSWKSIYKSITELNSELHKIESKSQPPQQQQQQQEEQQEQEADTNEPNNGSLQRRNTFTIEPIQDHEFDDPTSSLFNFGNILESKKARYKKLVMTKSEKVKQILKLNVQLKWDHELVAVEITKFLKLRSHLLSYGIKEFTKFELIRLKNRHLELSQALFSLRVKSKQSPRS
ncbi:UPF0507 protein [Scheffersomyces amazonensis]|uniref:UPF0507 protein n=1 Tax=Scheffersomyces amazonensis TaxID=1078765 RepID=UPI00315D2F42